MSKYSKEQHHADSLVKWQERWSDPQNKKNPTANMYLDDITMWFKGKHR